MPATIVNIQWNAGTSSWSGASASISKSAGIIFNVAIGNTSGVRICLSNSNVFGVTYLDYNTNGNQTPAVTGNVGASSSYHLQNYGTACVPQITAAEPYAIDIGTAVPKDT